MMQRALVIVALFLLCAISSLAWRTSNYNTMRKMTSKFGLRMAVEEIPSVAAFDDIVKSSGDQLIVIDYSTTWCGPCKIVLPKYIELSDKYPNVKFLKCIGDATPEASALLKREGVRSVPAFHFWKSGARFDSINGAKIDEVEALVASSQ